MRHGAHIVVHEELSRVADNSAPAVRPEGETVAEGDPENGNHADGYVGLEDGGDDVAVVDHASVEETEGGGHDQNQRRAH